MHASVMPEPELLEGRVRHSLWTVPWSLERRHGACMPFKMSVVKETSISVSYEHLIQDCTTG